MVVDGMCLVTDHVSDLVIQTISFLGVHANFVCCEVPSTGQARLAHGRS